MVLRIDERLADRLLVAERGDGGHLGDHAIDRQLPLLGVARIERVLAVDRQGADHGAENRHRVGVGREAGEDRLHPLVQESVPADVLAELLQLIGRGQLAVDQQIRDLLEVAPLGQLLDPVPAVAEDPLIAVDVVDRAHYLGGVRKPFIQGDVLRLGKELGDVDHPVSLGPDADGELVGLLAQLQFGCLAHGTHRQRGLSPLQKTYR